MYSAVMMIAMAASPEAPNCGHRAASCYGCYGGGCYGYAYGGCTGRYYGGCYGGAGYYPSGGSYYTYYYGGPVWYYADAGPVSPPSVGGSVTRLPAPSLAQAPAMVEVTLPENAKLFVDTQPITSQGNVRRLVSPPVEAGKDYTYLLTATIMRDQKEVKVDKRVTVRAGQTTPVSFEFPSELAVR